MKKKRLFQCSIKIPPNVCLSIQRSWVGKQYLRKKQKNAKVGNQSFRDWTDRSCVLTTNLKKNQLLITGPLGINKVNLNNMDAQGDVALSIKNNTGGVNVSSSSITKLCSTSSQPVGETKLSSETIYFCSSSKSFFRAFYSLFANQISGVTRGFLTFLRISGIGYRCVLENRAYDIRPKRSIQQSWIATSKKNLPTTEIHKNGEICTSSRELLKNLLLFEKRSRNLYRLVAPLGETSSQPLGLKQSKPKVLSVNPTMLDRQTRPKTLRDDSEFMSSSVLIGVHKNDQRSAPGQGSLQTLRLKVGFSHDLLFLIPESIKCFLIEGNLLCLYGVDKNQVTQIASKIRAIQPPSIYKGKGIAFSDEVINIKQGKRK